MPTGLARGPWSPDHQHGGAPTGLLTRAVEQVETVLPMRLVRITFEFLGPLPLEEMTVTTEVIRPGKRVQWVAATIEVGGRPAMRAMALFMRVEEDSSPIVDIEPAHLIQPTVDLRSAVDHLDTDEMFAGHAVDIRMAGGKENWLAQGLGRAWFRLKVPLVAGEEPTAQQRAVSAADFGNGISAALDWGEWLFVNSDLTVNLSRAPVGEWILLDAVMRISGDGTALTETSLSDTHGGIGKAAQSLFVAPSSGASSFGKS